MNSVYPIVGSNNMKNCLKYFIVILLGTISCTKENTGTTDSNKKAKKEVKNQGYLLTSDFPTKTYKVGEIYRSKIYLNDNSLYSDYGVKPKFVFKFGKTTGKGKFGELTKIIGDTGYVEFVVDGDSVSPEEEKIKYWSARIIIPLPEKDTIFALQQAYIVKK
jgi:hypothetical protein